MKDPRLFLYVPFSDNPQVLALGAKFDPRKRKWYVPRRVDAAAFARWLPVVTTDSEGVRVTTAPYAGPRKRG